MKSFLICSVLVLVALVATGAPKEVLQEKALDGAQVQALLAATERLGKECSGLTPTECQCIAKPANVTALIKPTKNAVFILVYPNENCFEVAKDFLLAVRADRASGAVLETARGIDGDRLFRQAR
jgi:hypothetical protein